MRAVDIIEKKREKNEINREEIEFFLNGYLTGTIPDYQMAAFLMAGYINGFTAKESVIMTEIMRDSGNIVDTGIKGKFIIDKHSTGGVGDKTTIALAPLLASIGVLNIKLSGRGLGHTGGTVDKFESIPGFKFPQNLDELNDRVSISGVGIMGYSSEIVPLDKKIYALRDVTATVSNISLIASSIMSKKLAVLSNGIILDVKVGEGAFMQNIDDARALADLMIEIAVSNGRKCSAILTDMEEPLGNYVGNGLEVIEAVEYLKGKGAGEFKELVEEIAVESSLMAGVVTSREEAVKLINEKIESGEALEKFRQFITACGGNTDIIEDYSILTSGADSIEVYIDDSGYIEKVKALEIGKASMILGAGREKKEDEINYSAGVVLYKKSGEYLEKGEAVAKIYYSKNADLESAEKLIKESYVLSKLKTEKRKVILERRGEKVGDK